MMRFLPVFLLAAFLVSIASPASADPISGWVITALGLKGAAATIFGALFNIAASVALTLLGRQKQKESGVEISGTTAGEEPSQRAVIGRYATGGHLAYHNSHGTGGTPNEYYTMVIALSALPGVSLRGLIVNDKRTALGEPGIFAPHLGQPMLRFRQGGDDYGWIRFYDGSQTEADAHLVDVYGNDPDQPYTNDHIGTGVAYAIITLRLNREVWSGIPKLRFILNGIPLYDPRKDSTAGGSGAHRWGQPATYDPSENPIVQAYNVMRGIPTPDGDVYGGEDIEAADLPLSNWIAGMNICDVQVGQRARFTAGLEFTLDTEPAAVVEELLKACLGQISETGGVFRIRVAEPDEPVFSITDGDISISDPQQFIPFPGLEATHNVLRINHPQAGALWQPVQTPLRRNAAWEAADGGQMLSRQLPVPACFNHGQAQALEAAYIADDRRFRVHQIVLPADAQQLEALDSIEWTSAANGYIDKIFEVAEAVYLPGRLFVVLTIRERDPDDYDWSSERELPPPPELTPTPIDERVIPAAEWTVTAAVVEDETGTARRPAISINWTPGVVTDARALRYQVRVADTNVLATQGRVTPSDGTALVSEGVLPATGYIARLRPVLDRPSDWTDWKPVTTPDVRITHEDVAPDLREEFEIARELLDGNIETIIGVIGDLRDRIRDVIAPIVTGPGLPPLPTVPHIERLTNEIAAEVAERVENLLLTAGNIRNERDRIRRIAQEVMEAAAHGEGERQEIRREISVELGDVRAAFNESITLLASQEAALAQQVTQLVAEANDLAAEILRVDTARVDGENALASQISLLSVGSAIQFDHVSIWYWDDTVEGWTGSPDAPTVSGDGWLVPAGYVVSPAGLEVDSAAYRQVRARLRNEPGAWADAYLYWAVEGQGWDNARRVAIDDPGFAGDEAVLTINPSWSGEIDRIRVDLPAGVEIDWLAVGRPAPGASSADIAAERQARISATEALAQDILALTAELTSASGDITANADALQSLTARVTETEDGITSLAQAQTAIQSEITNLQTGQTALSQAVDNLETLTVDIEDALRTQSTATRAVRSSAALRSNDMLEALAQALGRDTEIRDVVATATQELRTSIELTDEELRIVAEAVTQLQAAIPGLATADALQILITRVVATEDGVESLAASLLTLTATVGDNTAAISTEQQARASGDSALAALITSLTAEVGDNSAAITVEQQARVDGDEALAGQIISLSAEVGDNAAAITTEQQARADGDSALAGQITTVSATANSRNRTYRQSTAPTSPVTGDIWFNTSDANRPRRWSGSAWVLTDDTRIAGNAAAITTEQQARADGDSALAAQIVTIEAAVDDNAAAITTEQQARADADSALSSQINTVSATANARNRTYRQATAPSSPVAGDIWYDTSDANRPRRWSGSAWVLTDDTRIAQNAAAITTESQARADADSALAAQVTTISATANSRNRTFRQSTPPSNPVTGDIWYDTSDGRRPKRWSGSAWVLTDDTRIAQNAAAITTETVARADADEALAGQITTLTATVNGNTASISNLAATRVTAEGAVAAVEQEISAEYGDLTALATATAFAEATIDGIREGFIWRTGAGGAIELVSVDDGTDGPVTTARIRGDYILLDGNVAIEGNFLVEGEHVQLSADTTVSGYLGSPTFNESSGWRINADGSAEFRSLTIREGIIGRGPIAVGAVTESFSVEIVPEITDITSLIYPGVQLDTTFSVLGSTGDIFDPSGGSVHVEMTGGACIGARPALIQLQISRNGGEWETVAVRAVGFFAHQNPDIFSIMHTSFTASYSAPIGTNSLNVRVRARRNASGDESRVSLYGLKINATANRR